MLLYNDYYEMRHIPSGTSWRGREVRPTVGFEPGSASTAARCSTHLTIGYLVIRVCGKKVRRGYTWRHTANWVSFPNNAHGIDTACRSPEAAAAEISCTHNCAMRQPPKRPPPSPCLGILKTGVRAVTDGDKQDGHTRKPLSASLR